MLDQERCSIVEYGRRMVNARLTTGSGGNLSIFNREQGLVAMSPSGMEYDEVREEDVVVVDLAGHVVEGKLKPSSEIGFHLALYRHRADVNAVVHTHSVHATTIACLNWELPAVHYLVGFAGHKVPLAPYATFGTPELADNVVNTIGEFNACLLANHGLVAVGGDIKSAFAAAEELELVAQVYLQARSVGEPVILSESQMDAALEKFATYGQAGKG